MAGLVVLAVVADRVFERTLTPGARLLLRVAAIGGAASIALAAWAALGQATLAIWLVPYLAGLGLFDAQASVTAAAVVVLVSLTVLQVVISELVPKSLALQFPTQVALATVLPMV